MKHIQVVVINAYGGDTNSSKMATMKIFTPKDFVESTQPSIVLLLKNEHYVLLKPKNNIEDILHYLLPFFRVSYETLVTSAITPPTG